MPRNFKSKPALKKSIQKKRNGVSAASQEKSNIFLDKQRIDQSFLIRRIDALTDVQRDAFDAFDDGFNLILTGAAGTGKSFILLYLALDHILKNRNNENEPSKIVIVRSTVPTREVGFLPGTAEEKIAVYEEPYKAIVNNLFRRGDAWQILKTKKIIEFCSTSFLRGTTIDDSFIFVDEYSNCNLHELETVITRAGRNTRLLFSGDTVQSDLFFDREKNGHTTFMKILENMESFDIIKFGIEDIVRSGVVKEYLLAKHKLGL